LFDVSGAITDWLVKVLQEFGDPATIEEPASAFVSQAATLRNVHAELTRQLDSIEWSGGAATAHAAVWRHHLELAEQTASSLDSVGRHLDAHAQKAWAIVKEVLGVVLEILELLAAGALLTWVTAGLSDLIWIRAAPMMQRIMQLLGEFRTLVSEFVETMRGFGSLAGKVGETIETLAINYAPAYARAYLGYYITLGVPQLLSGRPVDWKNNSWQVATFALFDGTLNLIEDAIETTAAGKSFKDFITGSPGRTGVADTGAVDGELATEADLANELRPEANEPHIQANQHRLQQVPQLPEVEKLESIDIEQVLGKSSSDGSALTLPATESMPTSVAEAVEPASVASVPEATEQSGETAVAGDLAAEPSAPVVWSSFVPKTAREALYLALKEGFNTAIGNAALLAVIEQVTGVRLSAKEWAVNLALSGLMAGTRQGLFHHLPMGEKFGYRNQPTNAPAVERWLASTPITWSYYAMYFTLKDAINNTIFELPTPTELDPMQTTAAQH
jgi:hypothetical protein